MDFDVNFLIASIVISGVGFVLFSYGRSMKRAPQMAVGIALMVFPYFVSSILWMLVISAVLLLGLWIGLRSGW